MRYTLDLLPIFVAPMEERSVTRAGRAEPDTAARSSFPGSACRDA